MFLKNISYLLFMDGEGHLLVETNDDVDCVWQ